MRPGSRAIIRMADGPGDRWPGCSGQSLDWLPAAWREESPDTVVVGSQEPVTNTLQPLHGGFRVKGDAPGNARGRPRRFRACLELHA